ncbi:MAG TPA: hypothetical protein VFX51_29070 [Solirubrobacteraceae bacterium]|nr:hypothetical protein [Solirubrobacteraceae bacterium]
MVGDLAQRPVDLTQPQQRVSERGLRRVVDRDVVQPCDAVGLRRPARGLPGVEAEVVVIAAGGNKMSPVVPQPGTPRASNTTSKPSTPT